LLLAVAQRLLGALALADVAPDVEDVRLAVEVDRHAAQVDLAALSGFRHARGLEHDGLAAEDARVQLANLRLDLARRGDQLVAAAHLIAGVAAHRDVRGVDVDDAEVRIPQHEGVRRRVKDGAVLLLACPQGFLGAAALGDVAADVEHVRLAAVADRHAARLDVEAAAVLAPGVRLENHPLAGGRTPRAGPPTVG